MECGSRVAECLRRTGTPPLEGPANREYAEGNSDFRLLYDFIVLVLELRIPFAFGSLSRFAGGPMASQPKLFLPELRATLALAIPMMIGQFGQMLMGITDTLVLGRVGVVPLGAVGFSNTLLGTLYVGGIGLLASIGIFAAKGKSPQTGYTAFCRRKMKWPLPLFCAFADWG